MGFAKTLKLWTAYSKTHSVQTFIDASVRIYPDADRAVLRAVWHAFEVASEHAKPKAAPPPRQVPRKRERLDAPVPAKRPAPPKRKVGARNNRR